jgi:hypothetical protein
MGCERIWVNQYTEKLVEFARDLPQLKHDMQNASTMNDLWMVIQKLFNTTQIMLHQVIIESTEKSQPVPIPASTAEDATTRRTRMHSERYLQLRGRMANSAESWADAIYEMAIVDAYEMATAAVRSVVSSQEPARHGPGRPPKEMVIPFIPESWLKPYITRKPRAIVYCPVPGCKGVAAPVFGMACSLHKDVPRAEIALYFKQRREMKSKLSKSAIYGRPGK